MPCIQNVPGLNIVKVVEKIMGVSHEKPVVFNSKNIPETTVIDDAPFELI